MCQPDTYIRLRTTTTVNVLCMFYTSTCMYVLYIGWGKMYQRFWNIYETSSYLQLYIFLYNWYIGGLEMHPHPQDGSPGRFPDATCVANPISLYNWSNLFVIIVIV